MLRETDGGTWLLAREGDNGYSLYTRVAQQQQPAVTIFGAAAPAAMQIDPAGAGSPGAAVFGSPATRGTPAAGPQQSSSLFGSSRPASNWMAHGVPGAAFGQQPGAQQ